MANRGGLPLKGPLGGLMPEDAALQQFVTPQMIEQLTIKIQTLRRDNVLLLTQLARAAKCLNAVSAENTLLKTEVASLQSGGIGQ